MKDLNRKAFAGLLRFFIVLCVLLFLPSWTFHWWQAWVFLGVFSTSVLTITLYIMKYDPKLLGRRMAAGPADETERKQKLIQTIASLGFGAILVIPSIDHRLHWSHVPAEMSIVGDFLVALGLVGILFVFRENTYTGGIITVEFKQTVVSTGPYALVRHPMYASAFIMLSGMPVALGSWWGLMAFVPLAAAIIWRLVEEEAFLVRNLPGYADYIKKVKFRLVPGVW